MDIRNIIIGVGLVGCMNLWAQDITMIEVEGGSFQMGNSSNKREAPRHSVTISDFSISTLEITNAQYAAFLKAYGSDEVQDGEYIGKPLLMSGSLGLMNKDGGWMVKNGYENLPAVRITWYGADTFCKWNGGRLPTEAEWEYAAKGGKKSKNYTYSGSNTATVVAWCYDNLKEINQPVGKLAANELGLYDMSGNIAEWCSDYWGYYDDGTGGNKDPQGVTDGVAKVIRGGYIMTGVSDLRLTAREALNPEEAATFVGFRLVKGGNETAVSAEKTENSYLYPNPAHAVVNLTNVEEVELLDIMSLDGYLIKRITENLSSQINVSDLTIGCYLVKVQLKEKKTPVYTKLVIK